MPTESPPSLVALMAPERRREHRMKICLSPAEAEALAAFARQSGVRPATLAGSMVRAALQRLLQEQAEGILERGAA